MKAFCLSRYRETHDIHTASAAEVKRVEESAMTADIADAKNVINFGIVYGRVIFGLLRHLLSISKEQARIHRAIFFQRFIPALRNS